MDNNVLIKITADTDLTEAQMQIQELTKKNRELEEQMKQTEVAEAQVAKNIKTAGMAQQAEAERLKQNAQLYAQYRKEIQQEINANKQSIASLQQNVKTYNMLNGAGVRMRTQLMLIREELNKLADAGDMESDKFIELSVAAAKMQDQMGDTQRTIQILADDNKELTAAMSAGSGLTGAFNAGVSAMSLFTDETEELNRAFLKVQATMSILNGVQQVFNALNHESAARVVLRAAYHEVFGKTLAKETAIQTANNAAVAAGATAATADATAKGVEAAATGAATKAQWSLNAAMAANPIGAIVTLVVAATAAIAALGFGIYQLVSAFTGAGVAQRAFKKDMKELEKTQTDVSIQLAAANQKIVEGVRKIDFAEQQEINNARKRNASQVELAQIQLKYAQQRAKVMGETIPKAIEKQREAEQAAKKVYQDALEVVSKTEKGTKKYKEALEQLESAEKKYIETRNEAISLAKQAEDANQAEIDATQSLADATRDITRQTASARIELIKDGQTRELAQINNGYKEQLDAITGNSAEELELRKTLLAKQAKEIADVRRKYALEEKQAEVDMLKTLSNDTPYDSDLAREAAQAEAQYKIDALDKEAMGEMQYAAQVWAIRSDLANRLRSIDNEEAARKANIAKLNADVEIQEAQRVADQAGDLDVRLTAYATLYERKEQLLRDNAKVEIEAVESSVASEEEKAARIKAIESQLTNDVLANTKARSKDEITAIVESTNAEIQARRNAADEVLAMRNKSIADEAAAREELKAMREAEYAAQQNELQAQYDAQLITKQEFEQKMGELNHERVMAEIAEEEEKLAQITQIATSVLDTVSNMVTTVFGAFSDHIKAQIEELNEMYTTDAEEAAKDARKKYITEKDLEEKKAALQLKAQRLAKAQTLLNIGLGTAQAIVQTLAMNDPTPFRAASWVQVALVSALGAAQLAAAAAKPLPQYAKGRKGGKGEYAIVGERGAELMYVPNGASIVPHNKMENMNAWGEYGVPRLDIPATAKSGGAELQTAAMLQMLGMQIDYSKLGKAVADNIPEQKAVHVHVDRSGVTVQDGDTHKYLNTKYQAAWS